MHPEVHCHAGFQIYVDGVKQDFNDSRYFHYQLCGRTDETDLSPAEEQIEKAHLHEGASEIVHVHRDGATWGDLFKNLKFEYDQSKPIVGYTESGVIHDILNSQILDKQSVVILIGNQHNVRELLNKRVSLEQIEEVATASESCGTN